jgi:ribulose-5-phosphate 4-epimerase/fuculose-1-phosphate aldolase
MGLGRRFHRPSTNHHDNDEHAYYDNEHGYYDNEYYYYYSGCNDDNLEPRPAPLTGTQPSHTVRGWLPGGTSTHMTWRIEGVEYEPRENMLPQAVSFRTVEEERTHRKVKLAGALHIFGRLGFGEGVAGHITVRDPEHPELFWVNPFGMSFRHIRSSDLILVDHAGHVVVGDHPVNRAAFVIHSAIHEARPDVISAAHAHSVYGKAFSSLHIPLAPLTQDACVFYEDHEVIHDGGGEVVFDAAAGRALAAKLHGKAAIHANHGLFTVGASVDEAAFWFISMERSCQAQLLAMAAGDPVEVKPEWARSTRDQTGHSYAGWLSFQPLWQEICRTDPEICE